MLLRCGLRGGRILVQANGGTELCLRRRISIGASCVRNIHTHNTAIIVRPFFFISYEVSYTWKVLKCGAGEGWKRSVGSIM